MNSVVLTGRVAQDLQCKQTANSQYCRFRIAVDRRFKKGETDFFTCVVWGKGAQALADHSYKGAKICVSGSLQSSEYDSKDGAKKRDVEINVSDFDMIDFKSADMQAPASDVAPDISDAPTDDLEQLGIPFEF